MALTSKRNSFFFFIEKLWLWLWLKHGCVNVYVLLPLNLHRLVFDIKRSHLTLCATLLIFGNIFFETFFLPNLVFLSYLMILVPIARWRSFFRLLKIKAQLIVLWLRSLWSNYLLIAGNGTSFNLELRDSWFVGVCPSYSSASTSIDSLIIIIFDHHSIEILENPSYNLITVVLSLNLNQSLLSLIHLNVAVILTWLCQ